MEMDGNKNPLELSCDICHYITSSQKDFNKHVLTQKHQKHVNGNKKPKKNPLNLSCEKCNYVTSSQKDFNKHVLTQKHKNTIERKEKPKKSPEKIPNNVLEKDKNKCTICNKLYSNYSGLWKHKKKCIDNNVVPETKDITNMVLELFKRQDFLQNTLVELAKNQAPNHNTTNSNNNTQNFNLQFFLNETCKDAMNIDEFIKSLKVTMEDFETTGKIGYVEGITRIILNGLKQVDTTKRPIHCTDVKRDTVYIKDEDTWEKEEPDKNKLKKAVNQVARMNLSQLPHWQKENPKSEILDTRENDQYVKYSLAALGGKSDEEDDRFVNKIMKNIAKEVTIR